MKTDSLFYRLFQNTPDRQLQNIQLETLADQLWEIDNLDKLRERLAQVGTE
ncbi:hypothetical protein [Methylotuvimicrobium sp. KM1]|uniref:hypothetical protein n=1 Tax=Methylotuvimicrobium sp. KM1 TaxID=3377707 RepID=UPI00384C8AFA